MNRAWKVILPLMLILLCAGNAAAVSIGNWSGSNRSWNNGDFATINSLMVAEGHTVHADAAITAANLALYDVFVVGEAGSTPDAAELSLLNSFVSGGGILLLLGDSGNSGQPGLNNISSGLGLALNWGGDASSSGLVQGGDFASEGGRFNIVGQNLSLTPGTAVSGGSTLISQYVNYQALGLGWVFATADRSDHNVFGPSASNTNGQLFLNIVEGGQGAAVPEPASMLLLGSGLLAASRLRKRA